MLLHRLISLALFGAPVAALETPVTGARQLGMGAAGIAVTEDHTVPWWNPAALGWDSGADAGPSASWASGTPGGAGVEAMAGFHAYGDIIQHADALLHLADRVHELGQTGIANASDLEGFLTVIRRLNAIADPADALGAQANAAGSLRIGRFAIGARWGGEAFAWADDVDLRNVVPAVNGDALADAINASGQGHDGSFRVLDSGQAQVVYQSLGGSGAFDAASDAGQAALRIDSALRSLGSAAPAAADVATWLAATVSASGTLDQNTTSVLVKSFSYVEIPVSAGMPIGEHLALGGSLKLIHGRVHGTRILVFQEDVENAVTDLKGGYRDSLNIGVDLGLQAKAGSWRFAATGTNLNAPSFRGPAGEDGRFDSVRLDPQLTLGLGWRPAGWLTFAADMEQFPNHTINDALRTQRAGCGLEFAAIPLLDLRAGVYANLADSASPPVATLGAGIGPEWLRLDAALACASEMQDFGQWRLPTALKTSLGLSGRW